MSSSLVKENSNHEIESRAEKSCEPWGPGRAHRSNEMNPWGIQSPHTSTATGGGGVLGKLFSFSEEGGCPG